MALKEEAEKVMARKKLSELQRGALHVQMQEREVLKREVRAGPRGSADGMKNTSVRMKSQVPLALKCRLQYSTAQQSVRVTPAYVY